MGSNMYLYEKAREVHYQELRRLLEQRQVLARQLHRRSMGRHAAGALGVLLLKLGAWLKQFEHAGSALEDRV
jgi:hypothetical protein